MQLLKWCVFKIGLTVLSHQFDPSLDHLIVYYPISSSFASHAPCILAWGELLNEHQELEAMKFECHALVSLGSWGMVLILNSGTCLLCVVERKRT